MTIDNRQGQGQDINNTMLCLYIGRMNECVTRIALFEFVFLRNFARSESKKEVQQEKRSLLDRIGKEGDGSVEWCRGLGPAVCRDRFDLVCGRLAR